MDVLMPAPGSATLALSDAELRETLDLHSRVIASMSDRLDAQTALQAKTGEAILKSLAATQNAAVAAKNQTDPAQYARRIQDELDKAMGKTLGRLDAATAAEVRAVIRLLYAEN